MLLIAGLGNPGPRYASNRHNIGFMAADAIARRHSFSPWSKKFRAEIADGTIAGEKVLLVKPMTFMNLSGEAVGEAMRFYKLSPADLIVFHDELDLDAGRVRIKTGGGHGGHNGLKSIDAHCGKDYRRVRLGIGHPGRRRWSHGHVLGDFSKVDGEWLDPLLEAIADNAGTAGQGPERPLPEQARPGPGEGARACRKRSRLRRRSPENRISARRATTSRRACPRKARWPRC